MSDQTPELQRLVPEKLTVTFSTSRIFHCLLIAIAAHLLLMAMTSVGYVRDTWIDPEGAARRKAERLAAKEEEEAGAPAPTSRGRVASPATADEAKPGPRTAEEAEMEKRKDAPVIQEITAKAKTSDIPKDPDDLGISIEETNP
jgi:hypothetical protein